MYVVLLLVVVVLEFSSIGVLAAERDAEAANIRSASDALWWGYVTITTVGYGDRFPVTNYGRVVGVFLLTIGVGLFATFTGFIANFFLAPRQEPEDDELERLRARVAELESA
jgi:voltage-gated potassium channel